MKDSLGKVFKRYVIWNNGGSHYAHIIGGKSKIESVEGGKNEEDTENIVIFSHSRHGLDIGNVPFGSVYK